MRRLLCATFMLAFLWSCGARSQGHLFFFSPLLSYDNFHTLGFSNGLDFGFDAGVRLTSTLALVGAASFGARDVPFATVGGSDVLHTRIVAYEAVLERTFLGRAGAGETAVLAGGGGIHSAVDARTIAAGALGSVTVPERSQTQGFLKAGLRMNVPLAGRTAFTVSPALRVFTPFSSSSVDLSVTGGIRVSLF